MSTTMCTFKHHRIARSLTLALLLPLACGDDEATGDDAATPGSGDASSGETDPATSDDGPPAETTGGDDVPLHAAGGRLSRFDGYQGTVATGFALLVRHEGGTSVSLQVSGLAPDAEYPAHVHVSPCAQGAGGHYMIDASVEDALPDNELWPTLQSDPDGNASVEINSDHVARAEAVSVVVHDPFADGAKMLCADLMSSIPVDPFVTTGPARLLAGASAAGLATLTGTATMSRSITDGTHVEFDVAGLAPDQTYSAHVHARDCSTGDGGGHYEIDPAVEGAVEDNELWLSVSTDASGVGTAEVASPHLARAEAQSVVIHDNDEAGTRLACFDLEP